MLNRNQKDFETFVLESSIFIPVKKSNKVEKINKNKNLQSQQE